MQNNLINIFFVPEVSLSILAISCLMYGLFSKNNSFNKATNFATLSLLFITILIYFDFTTNFALFDNFFTNTTFTRFFKILTTLGAAATMIISKNWKLVGLFSIIVALFLFVVDFGLTEIMSRIMGGK